MAFHEYLQGIQDIVKDVKRYTEKYEIDIARQLSNDLEFPDERLEFDVGRNMWAFELGINIDFLPHKLYYRKNIGKWRADDFASADVIHQLLQKVSVAITPTFNYSSLGITEISSLERVYEWMIHGEILDFIEFNVVSGQPKMSIGRLNQSDTALVPAGGLMNSVASSMYSGHRGELEQADVIALSTSDSRVQAFTEPTVYVHERRGRRYVYRPQAGWWRDRYPESSMISAATVDEPLSISQLADKFTLEVSGGQYFIPSTTHTFNFSRRTTSLAGVKQYDLSSLLAPLFTSCAIPTENLILLNTLSCVYLDAYGGETEQQLLPSHMRALGFLPEVTPDYIFQLRPKETGLFIDHMSLIDLFTTLGRTVGGYLDKQARNTDATANIRMWALANGLTNATQNYMSDYSWPMVDISAQRSAPAGTLLAPLITMDGIIRSYVCNASSDA